LTHLLAMGARFLNFVLIFAADQFIDADVNQTFVRRVFQLLCPWRSRESTCM
jgi:hypothetical protein